MNRVRPCMQWARLAGQGSWSNLNGGYNSHHFASLHDEVSKAPQSVRCPPSSGDRLKRQAPLDVGVGTPVKKPELTQA
eukprot:1144286-Pelagomonas_calceolata.AAC.5